MSDLTAKVCVVGDFAVGKTSTVERFVNNQFSDKYLTTIGVKVDTKDVPLPGGATLKLILWDVAGTDRFGDVEFAYLRGASGYILVADGTRSETVAIARGLREQAKSHYGEVPCVFLLNKADLTEEWDVSGDAQSDLQHQFADIFITSARTGENVETAIMRLGAMIAARDFSIDS